MTESRVVAVAAPLEQFLKRSVGLTDYAAGQYAKELAVQAIEANDAWLADDWTTRRKLFNEQMRALVELRFKPSPEEPNR